MTPTEQKFEDMVQLKKEVEDISSNVKQVMTVLLPNQYTKKGGMINDFQELSTTLQQLREDVTGLMEWKEDMSSIVKKVLQVGTALIVIGTLVIQIFSYFKK